MKIVPRTHLIANIVLSLGLGVFVAYDVLGPDGFNARTVFDLSLIAMNVYMGFVNWKMMDFSWSNEGEVWEI